MQLKDVYAVDNPIRENIKNARWENSSSYTQNSRRGKMIEKG